MSGPRTDTGAVPAWLALREPADAQARAAMLLDPLREHLRGLDRPIRIHDLGAGTGAAQRWLAPQLDGAQHWVLHDREPDRLAEAPRRAATRARDGAPVDVEVRVGDVVTLDLRSAGGADLVTASALLDLLTPGEIRSLATACAGRAVLWMLTVTGDVVLEPPDSLDDAVAAAFDGHQRRGGRLGPDAAEAAAAALGAAGFASVRSVSSPWRLGPDDAGLLSSWLDGRVDAAAEHRPDLPLAAYRARRAAGPFRAVVDHRDLLALP